MRSNSAFSADFEELVDEPGTGAGFSPDGSFTPPELVVRGGDLHELVEAAEAALVNAGVQFYQRGGQIVRPVLEKVKAADTLGMARTTEAWRIGIVSQSYMRKTLTQVVRFKKLDRRKNLLLPIDCPATTAEVLLASAGDWQRLEVLRGISCIPIIRADGSIFDEAGGYDRQTGLLYRPNGIEFDAVKKNPTREDAIEAMTYIVRRGPVREYPFVENVDYAVWLSGALSLIAKPLLNKTLAHCITSPNAGTGKSGLVDAWSIIATDRIAAVVDTTGRMEELEKRLDAELIAGSAIISLDNMEGPFGGQAIATLLSQERKSIRVMGHNDMSIIVPCDQFLTANGNNLVVRDDCTRRSIMCRLDAHVERPELRPFDFNPANEAKTLRPKLVTALLTILRAHLISGQRHTVQVPGGFDGWSRFVQEPLVWCNCPDPWETSATLAAADPGKVALRAVIAAWISLNIETKSFQPIRAGELIEKASERRGQTYGAEDPFIRPILRDALLAVAPSKDGRSIHSGRLGRWLSDHQGKTVDKLAIGGRELSGLSIKLDRSNAASSFWVIQHQGQPLRW
jgi:putative DNA primase/helicase